jgi:RAVE protein 1 C terminal
LLGDRLDDAASVCLKQLDDFQLAIAICRVYEGNDGPALALVLKDHVIPLTFRKGWRRLASWAFWMLKRRDLAVRVLVVRFFSRFLGIGRQVAFP